MTTEPDVLTRLRKLINDQLGIDDDKIVETRTLTDLGADSLDLVEITMTIEEEFGLSIEDDEAERLVTVGDVVELIESKM